MSDSLLRNQLLLVGLLMLLLLLAFLFRVNGGMCLGHFGGVDGLLPGGLLQPDASLPDLFPFPMSEEMRVELN